MYVRQYWATRYWAARYWAPRGLTAPGYYWAGEYWARRYFAPRYWEQPSDVNPFTATVETTLAVTATVGFNTPTIVTMAPFVPSITANISSTATLSIDCDTVVEAGEEFIAGMPLELPAIVATTTLSGIDVEYSYASGLGRYWSGHYWAARYFGPDYWGTQISFIVDVTAGLSIAGSSSFTLTASQALVGAVGNVTATGMTTIDGVVISYVAPEESSQKQQPAGRSRRRKKYEIEIDGQVFEAESEAEALALLEQAKEQAEEKASAVTSKAIAAVNRPKRKVLADVRKALKPPVIEATEPLQQSANAVLKQIQAIYDDALRAVEISALLKKQEDEQDDEDILLMLL
jgi:hypothetical protein